MTLRRSPTLPSPCPMFACVSPTFAKVCPTFLLARRAGSRQPGPSVAPDPDAVSPRDFTLRVRPGRRHSPARGPGLGAPCTRVRCPSSVARAELAVGRAGLAPWRAGHRDGRGGTRRGQG
jgi:hypothetical protein